LTAIPSRKVLLELKVVEPWLSWFALAVELSGSVFHATAWADKSGLGSGTERG
jgi:hypothetical protein